MLVELLPLFLVALWYPLTDVNGGDSCEAHHLPSSPSGPDSIDESSHSSAVSLLDSPHNVQYLLFSDQFQDDGAEPDIQAIPDVLGPHHASGQPATFVGNSDDQLHANDDGCTAASIGGQQVVEGENADFNRHNSRKRRHKSDNSNEYMVEDSINPDKHQCPSYWADSSNILTSDDAQSSQNADASEQFTAAETAWVNSLFENDDQSILAALDSDSFVQSYFGDLNLLNAAQQQPTNNQSNEMLVDKSIFSDIRSASGCATNISNPQRTAELSMVLEPTLQPTYHAPSATSSQGDDECWELSCSCAGCVKLLKTIQNAREVFDLDPVPILSYPARYIPDLRKHQPVSSSSDFLPRPITMSKKSLFLEAQVHLCSQGVFFHPNPDSAKSLNKRQLDSAKNNEKRFSSEIHTLQLYLQEALLQTAEHDVMILCPICSSRLPSLHDFSTCCTNPQKHRRKRRVLFELHHRLFIKDHRCVCGHRFSDDMVRNKLWSHFYSQNHMVRLWSVIQHYLATGNIHYTLAAQTACAFPTSSQMHRPSFKWLDSPFALQFGYIELLQSVYDSAPTEFWFASHCLERSNTT